MAAGVGVGLRSKIKSPQAWWKLGILREFGLQPSDLGQRVGPVPASTFSVLTKLWQDLRRSIVGFEAGAGRRVGM